MGKKYDAYKKATNAEKISKQRLNDGPARGELHDQNKADARQAELDANLVFDEFLEDPQG